VGLLYDRNPRSSYLIYEKQDGLGTQNYTKTADGKRIISLDDDTIQELKIGKNNNPN
jgi:hypothetical protein